jgi:hypothetical protein
MEKTKILGLGIVLMLLVGMTFAATSLAKAPAKSYTGTCYVSVPNKGIVTFPCAMRDYVTLPVHESRTYHTM